MHYFTLQNSYVCGNMLACTNEYILTSIAVYNRVRADAIVAQQSL